MEILRAKWVPKFREILQEDEVKQLLIDDSGQYVRPVSKNHHVIDIIHKKLKEFLTENIPSKVAIYSRLLKARSYKVDGLYPNLPVQFQLCMPDRAKKESEHFKGHRRKCRCCLKEFENDDKQINITKTVETRFFELTRIKLRSNSNLSSIVCEACFDGLQNFSRFQKDMTETQIRLYRHINILEPTATINDFNITLNRDINIENLEIEYDPNIFDSQALVIKTEEGTYETAAFINTDTTADDNGCEMYSDPFDDEPESELENNTIDSNLLADEQMKARRSVKNIKNVKRDKPKISLRLPKIPVQSIYEDDSLSETIFNKHVRTRHQGKMIKVKCKHCKKYISRAGIKVHIQRVHQKLKRFTCDLCGNSSFDKRLLLKHVLSHIPKEYRETYSCDHCSVLCTRKSSLLCHMERHKIDRATYPCLQADCGKVFVTKRNLLGHIAYVHKKVRRYQCSECGQTFAQSSKLFDHQNSMHTDPSKQRLYVCDICSFTCTYPNGLRKHHKKHEEKPFKCEMEGCSRRFPFRFMLTEHIDKVHYGKRDYVCPECQKSFFSLKEQQIHYSNVHVRPQVQCPVPDCARLFHRRDYIRKHIRDHLNIDNEKKEEYCKIVPALFPQIHT